jgi:hypothetical protein
MSVFNKHRVVSLACCALAFAACSGGSSGTSSSSGGTSSGGTTVTTASLQSVNNLPDFNIESLDAAASASVSPQLRNVEDGEADQEYSRAGCEIRSHVDEFKWQIKELRSNVCVVKKMESEAGMEVGVDEYNYYSMEFDAGEAPGEDVEGGSADFGFGARVRVGIIDDTLHMALCTNESTGSSYVQTMAMTFGVTDGQFDGIVKDVMPSNDGSGGVDGSFSIEAMLATDDPDEFSDGDEAAFLAQMASEMWGGGHIGLNITKDGDNIIDTVDAAFQSGNVDSEWGTWTSQAYGKFDSSEGCGTYSSDGTFPAMQASDAFDEETLTILFAEEGIEGSDQICWTHPEEGDCEDEDGCSVGSFVEEAVDGMCSFSEGGTECFSFELESGALGYFVLDPADALYYEDVAANEGLDDFEMPSIAFEGDEEWDCEDEADNEFVAIDPTEEAVQAAFETCFDIATDEGRAIESCYEQETQEDAEHDGGVEVHDEDQEFGGPGEGEDGGDEDVVECDTDCSQAGDNQANCEAIQSSLDCGA